MTSKPSHQALKIATYAADTDHIDRSWMARGICSESADPDAWHPANEHADDARSHRAKQACGHCPVAITCRNYAIDRPWMTGIWGGTTTDERRRVRRRTVA